MKVTKEKVENSQAFLTIEMEPAEVEESLQESYYRLVKKAKIPGFRQGKAPRDILERHIGKESLLDDAIDHLLPEAYKKAIAEQKIEAIAHPHIEIAQTEPLIFKATVPLAPTVKLGDYHQLRLMPETVEVTEKDVANIIEQLRHQRATWEPVERSVEFNDFVVFDFESSVEGKPLINQKGVQYQIIRDEPFLVPGFVEQIVGMRRDEEKEFKLQFPSDYPKAELAGKEGLFKVKVSEVKQEKVPELNDEFAKEINPEFKTLDALRKQISTNLNLRAEEKARIDFEEKVIDEAIKLSELEYPPVLVETEIDHIIEQQLRRWQMGGGRPEDYLKGIKKTAEELREELRPIAVKRVTRVLLLGKVSEEEKIEVSDAEIGAEVKNMAEEATENRDELEKLFNAPSARDSVKQFLTARKAMQRLAEIAKGSNIESEATQEEGKK